MAPHGGRLLLALICPALVWSGAAPGAVAAPADVAAGAVSKALAVTNSMLAGSRFATRYYVHDSGTAGPTVLIVGGAHGNEPAGAHAAEAVRRWPIRRGRMVVLPRANEPALQAGKRLTPGVSTNLSNLNRNYPRAGLDEPPRGELAEAVWELALKYKPDWLLDLHEGYDFHQLNNKSVGSSVIVFPSAEGLAAADLMLAVVNATITNTELKFVRRDRPVDGSLARACGEHLGIPAMTLETTSKQPMSKRVRQHEIMVHCLFQHLGMMDGVLPPLTYLAEAETAPTQTASSGAGAGIRVALYKGPGTGGAGPSSLMQRLNHAPHSSITPVTPEGISSGVLTNYDVVIFGGGSGSKQAEALGEAGRAAVREFVERGGGYIGICAGAYLATSGYPWGLNLINARTVSPQWRRGKGDVKLELTDSGRAILGDRSGQFDVRYVNGPIVKPAEREDLPAFETLAFFRTELAENDSPVGVMVNSPAIFSGRYKRGQVVCISPHPEQTNGLEDMVPCAASWVARKPITNAE